VIYEPGLPKEREKQVAVGAPVLERHCMDHSIAFGVAGLSGALAQTSRAAVSDKSSVGVGLPVAEATLARSEPRHVTPEANPAT
jgi:hypothetical protein